MPFRYSDLASTIALRRKRLVAITFSTNGRRKLALPFFDGEFPVATSLAYVPLTAGAPILPVFRVAEAPSQFSVTSERAARRVLELAASWLEPSAIRQAGC